MSGSWVTSTMVRPSRFSRWSSARISTLVRVSRLPVGSSARMTAGSLTSARAMATRCCWPPDSWLGWWCSRSARPTAPSRARPRATLARRDSAVEERQLDVLERARPGEQVEHLEHEADLRVAHVGQLVAREARDVLAVEPVAAGRRAIEAAEQVHEGGLAGARRAHDGHEFAGLDRHGDAAQRVHRVRAEMVVLAEVLGRDDRHGAQSLSRGPPGALPPGVPGRFGPAAARPVMIS